jgi:hypothetical protein
MRTRHRAGIALIAAMAVVATLALGSAAAAGGRTFNLALSSEVEVPTPNDAATGTAWLSINPGTRQVCFDISWDDVAGVVTMSHIHVAPAGAAGPIVVPLFMADQVSDAQGDGSASGCVTSTLSSPELAQIVGHPSRYYLNVHSSLNGPGAIRAQLDS